MSRTMQWPEFVDTGASVEHDRLALLEEIFDPFSIRFLDRIGLTPGWRCLEVGAGGGSIARVLAERAGSGNVVATDLSTRLLGPLAALGVTVLEHDVTADDAPGQFDLIHSRFVVDHLVERQAAINRMASWLKPGGWLLLEAGSTAAELSSRSEVGRAMRASNSALAESLGTDCRWARTLPLPLETAGLVNCTAEATALPVRGGSPMARWLRASFRLADNLVLATGRSTPEELELAYAAYDDPDFVDYTWLSVAAWGQRA